jgi:hypothetical protein
LSGSFLVGLSICQFFLEILQFLLIFSLFGMGVPLGVVLLVPGFVNKGLPHDSLGQLQRACVVLGFLLELVQKSSLPLTLVLPPFSVAVESQVFDQGVEFLGKHHQAGKYQTNAAEVVVLGVFPRAHLRHELDHFEVLPQLANLWGPKFPLHAELKEGFQVSPVFHMELIFEQLVKLFLDLEEPSFGSEGGFGKGCEQGGKALLRVDGQRIQVVEDGQLCHIRYDILDVGLPHGAQLAHFLLEFMTVFLPDALPHLAALWLLEHVELLVLEQVTEELLLPLREQVLGGDQLLEFLLHLFQAGVNAALVDNQQSGGLEFVQ